MSKTCADVPGTNNQIPFLAEREPIRVNPIGERCSALEANESEALNKSSRGVSEKLATSERERSLLGKINLIWSTHESIS